MLVFFTNFSQTKLILNIKKNNHEEKITFRFISDAFYC